MNKIVLPSIILLSISIITSCKSTDKDYSKYTVACMGDSITYGCTPFTGKQMSEPYPLLLQRDMGFKKVYNYGIPGSTVSSCPGAYCPMVERIKDIDPDCNLIIVWGSGNDYHYDYDYGEEGNTDPATYYGALYNICSFLDTNFKNSFKMFITSLPCKVDGTLYYLNTLKGAIDYTCNKFNIPVLDLTNNSGFEEEIESGQNDGVHPTQDFVKKVITPKIIDFIKNHL